MLIKLLFAYQIFTGLLPKSTAELCTGDQSMFGCSISLPST